MLLRFRQPGWLWSMWHENDPEDKSGWNFNGYRLRYNCMKQIEIRPGDVLQVVRGTASNPIRLQCDPTINAVDVFVWEEALEAAVIATSREDVIRFLWQNHPN